MNTITLKTAKEIQKLGKEKGIELPESEYVWESNILSEKQIKSGQKKEWKVVKNELGLHKREIGSGWWLIAYTTDELLEWLPYEIEKNIKGIPDKETEKFRLTLYKEKDKYTVFYGGERYCYPKSVISDTPAEALGLLAVRLMESNLLK